jgi:PAS domain S-box-containing protein
VQFWRTIRGRLILIVTAALLPALGVIFWTGLEQRDEAVRGAERQALLLARNFSELQQELTASTEQILRTLADVHHYHDHDSKLCLQILRAVDDRNDVYSRLFIAGPDGVVRISSKGKSRYDVSDRKYFRDALASKSFSAGEYVVGRDSGNATVHFAYPHLDRKREVSHVVAAALDLDVYWDFLKQVELPQGFMVSLVDHRGTRIIGFPDQPGTATGAGTPVSEESLRQISSGRSEGIYEAAGSDGVVRIHAFRNLHLKGASNPYMTVVVGADKASVLAPAGAIFRRNLLLLGLAFGAALGAAWLIGGASIAGRIRRLMEVSRQLRDGNLSVRTEIPHFKGELGILAQSFDEMAASLEAKTLERDRYLACLRESDERYRGIFENTLVGIFQSTLEGQYLTVNPALARMFGHDSPEEMIDSVTDIGAQLYYDPEDRRRAMKTLTTSDRLERFEARCRRRDGVEIWTVINSRSVRGADGRILYIEGVIEDISERKRVEDERRALQRRLADIIDFLPDATLVIDREGRVIAWNRAIEEMTGVKSEDMIGKGNYEYALPFYGERRPILIDIAMNPGLALDAKYNAIKRKNGAVVGEAYMPALRGGSAYLLGTASVLRDSEGNIAGAIESIHDLTARRKAEAALQDALGFNRAIIEGAEDGIAVLDKDLKFLAWNRVMASGTGIPAEDVLGKNALELFPPLTRIGMDRLLEKALRGETSMSADMPFSASPGASKWVQGHFGPYRDGAGNVAGVIGVFRDVTERVEAEKELQEEKERYRLLFENANDGVFVLDEGVIFDCNARAFEMFGCGKESVIGRKLMDFSPEFQPGGESSKARASRMLAGAEERESSGFFEWVHRRADGSLLSTEVSLTRFEHGGKPLVLAIVRDVSERKKAEEERRKLQHQLLQAQKMEALGTLAGGVAHDFNNVLAAIMGFTELAAVEEGEDARQECLDQVLTASGRARDLVYQILTFSRMRETGRRPVQMNPIVKEALKLLRSSIPATIGIRSDVDEDPVVVYTDPTQIHQVLMNLCTNAVHAMKGRKGTLSVSLTQERFGNGSFPAPCGLPEGLYAKLQVADTGYGMSREVLERVFEPFFTTKPHGEGTGLGLSVVYGIVQACRGAIDISSRPGKGTRVEVYLPAGEGAGSAGGVEEPDAAPGSEHVLFVDDEPALAELGSRALRSLGYRVTAKTNSLEALDFFRIRHRDVDLVITDVTMPFLTGAELARKMIEIRRDIPVILCTGYSEIVNEETARRIGARGYVMKPVSRADLARTVRNALDGGKEQA